MIPDGVRRAITLIKRWEGFSATLFTAGLQWRDRHSKRANDHVINKHGGSA